MTPLGAAVVALNGVVFLLWAWTLFAILFGLWSRVGAGIGGLVAGPSRQAAAIRAWWRDPAETPRRRRLAGLSVALLGLTLLWEAAGLEPAP